MELFVSHVPNEYSNCTSLDMKCKSLTVKEMNIKFIFPFYSFLVPMASVDGEPHEIIVLVAVCTGAILASIILIILIAMIEKTIK